MRVRASTKKKEILRESKHFLQLDTCFFLQGMMESVWPRGEAGQLEQAEQRARAGERERVFPREIFSVREDIPLENWKITNASCSEHDARNSLTAPKSDSVS